MLAVHVKPKKVKLMSGSGCHYVRKKFLSVVVIRMGLALRNHHFVGLSTTFHSKEKIGSIKTRHLNSFVYFTCKLLLQVQSSTQHQESKTATEEPKWLASSPRPALSETDLRHVTIRRGTVSSLCVDFQFPRKYQ